MGKTNSHHIGSVEQRKKYSPTFCVIKNLWLHPDICVCAWRFNLWGRFGTLVKEYDCYELISLGYKWPVQIPRCIDTLFLNFVRATLFEDEYRPLA